MTARPALHWMHADVQERFDARLILATNGECLLFNGALQSGWGRFAAHGFPGVPSGRVLAHRFAWVRTYGPIPEDHDIHHDHDLCEYRSCCLLEHLLAIDHSAHGGISSDKRWGAAAETEDREYEPF